MTRTHALTVMVTAALAIGVIGCQQDGGTAAAATSSNGAHSSTKSMSVSSYKSHEGYSARYSIPGYVAFEDDGRLWVFQEGSDHLADYLAGTEAGKNVTWPGEGPDGKTIRSVEPDTLLGYTASRPGFRVIPDDGRLWVFHEGSDELAEFLKGNEPGKNVTWIGAGPRATTIRSIDHDVLLEYVGSKPGFRAIEHDGRLWVFRQGSGELKDFMAGNEPAKNVTWIGEGPRGVSIRSTDADTLLAYVGQKDGFRTFAEDGRLWVFVAGSDALKEYLEVGEPGKNATLIGAGPRGVTIRSENMTTLKAYTVAP